MERRVNPTRKSTVKPSMPLLTQMAKLISSKVDAVLARDRFQIADDAEALSKIRQQMGLSANDNLADIRARYAKRECGQDLQKM